MGVADAMLKMQMQYGSQRALHWFENLMMFVQDVSYEESIKLGEERGTPEKCKLVNRRNITVQSVAPTGSIAIISGCSHGIEPIFSPSYTRIDERGNTYIVEHELKDEPYFSACIGHDNTPTVQEHLDILVTTQKYVDSGVSKTINLPNSASVEDVKNIFLYAWKNGVKGVTVYRDGSRDFQVLNNNSATQEDELKANCVNGVCEL